MKHGKNGIKSVAPGPCYNDRLYGWISGIAAERAIYLKG